MIISEQRKFIFIHIPKIGGTSIKRSLSPFFNREGLEKIPKRLRKSKKLIEKHDSAIVLKNAIKATIWNSYFKFTFVRNPWDWMVSIYCFIKKYKLDPRRHIVLNMTFQEFVMWFLKQDKWQNKLLFGQHSYIHYKDKKLVDFIGKLESFQQAFDVICDTIKIKRQQLGRHNTTVRKHYQEYYTKKLQQIVGEYFKKDIELFGYVF